MIHTSRQLKALVQNKSNGDSAKAQIIIRNYAMERFLERLSLSQYSNALILKGGTLIAAMVGIDSRSTMDVDATVKNLTLSVESAQKIVEDIISIEVDDRMSFNILSTTTIMDEMDYSGVRLTLEATLETMRTPLKIDFSSGDIITPQEINYSYKLLFENRHISILAYNLETILAEKIETLLSRGTANTRMRDFYDIFILENSQEHNYNPNVFVAAFEKTSQHRGSSTVVSNANVTLDEIQTSSDMTKLWRNYQNKFDYAIDISWDDIMNSVRRLCSIIGL